ncbi:MAG: hypothetical protein RL660_2251 [Bacteroidota bacterium]|jgi:hypothetical protein
MKSTTLKIAALAFCIAAVTSSCKKEKEDRTILLSDVPGAVLTTDSIYNNDIDINTPYDTTATFSWTQPDFGTGIIVGHEIQFATTEGALGGTSGAFSYKLPAKADMFAVVDKQILADFAKVVASGNSTDVFVRIKSYPFNNPKAKVAYSNVKKLNWTRNAPILPATNQLYLTGNGGPGWTNPVPSPLWKLNRINENTYTLRATLQGDKEFVILPENGSWDTKYCLASGDAAMPGIENGGGFVFRYSGGDNFKTPATTGLYNLVFDFTNLQFTIAPSYDSLLPAQPAALYIVGDGTQEGWTNTPSGAQQFTQVSSNVFEYEGSFVSGKLVKFLSVIGAWQPQYGVVKDKPGTLGYAAAAGAPEPDAIPTPATDGNYKLTVDFYNGTYSWTAMP